MRAVVEVVTAPQIRASNYVMCRVAAALAALQAVGRNIDALTPTLRAQEKLAGDSIATLLSRRVTSRTEILTSMQTLYGPSVGPRQQVDRAALKLKADDAVSLAHDAQLASTKLLTALQANVPK